VLPFTGLDHPVGVAVDLDGAVYVTDSDNNRVVKLAGSSYTQSVPPFTALNHPVGVSVEWGSGTSNGNAALYVTDANNNRVLWAKAPSPLRPRPGSPPRAPIGSGPLPASRPPRVP
jgi:serine/threonine-protein kinase